MKQTIVLRYIYILIKAFKFMTNDVIQITVDYDAKKMTFKKKNEKYEL